METERGTEIVPEETNKTGRHEITPERDELDRDELERDEPERDETVAERDDIGTDPETDTVAEADRATGTGTPAVTDIDTATETQAGVAEPETRAEEPAALFTADEAGRYLDDWRTVQASFVDDPQAAVGKAEALVGNVIDAVTTRISQRRAELSGQRTSTDGERTEQLRQALRGYRALLRQLLPDGPSEGEATRLPVAVGDQAGERRDRDFRGRP